MKCEYCKDNAHYVCPICSKFICPAHSKVIVSCKDHIQKRNKPDIVIRFAKKEEESILEEIEDSMISEHEEKVDEEEWERKWERIETKTVVAEIDGKIAGFVEYCKTVNPHEDVILMATDFAILPEFQSYGAGSMLFDKLKEIAKKEGLSRVCVSTSANNIPSIIFHLKNGAEIYHFEKAKQPTERFGIKGKQDISFVYNL